MQSCPAPSVQGERYPWVSLFRGSIVLKPHLLDHVAQHKVAGDGLASEEDRGCNDPCGFCGSATGRFKTTLKKEKVHNTCTYRAMFKYKVALKAKRNVPWNLPCQYVPPTVFTLNLKPYMQLYHPKVNVSSVATEDEVVEKTAPVRVHSQRGKHVA